LLTGAFSSLRCAQGAAKTRRLGGWENGEGNDAG
jgi:hypothetical protein